MTTQQPSAQPLSRQGAVRSMADFYLTTMRTQIQTQFQYRAATYMYLVGMVAEPVIYLVVWTTIAEQNGGTVNGITTGQLAAYYIVWTLVRNMNIVFTPYGWEGRIREGELSSALLRPLHPIHYDIAQFAGGKVIWVLLYLPIAAGLWLIFDPDITVTPLEIFVFLIAIWGAYLIRTMMLWLLGMVSIWTTRGSAIFETYVVAELLLSGRLVPMPLMPDWAQTLASFLPFQWTFYFPIQALVGDLSAAELIGGLGMQALWIAIGSFLVWICFRASVKHYTAVGN
jgi:ABC-2 type transport system permease protein